MSSTHLRRTTLSGDAYDFVRNLVVSSDRLKPGDKISVEQLSRELGVSRTPLWGAINRLEAEGVVEIVPRQGVYVVDYNPDRVVSIFIAREALEGMAARLAAERITDRQLRDLTKKVEAQKDRALRSNRKQYDAVALDVHEEIVKIAGNPMLHKLLTQVFAQIRAMRVRSPRKREYDVRPHHENHDGLLQALRSRDPDRAEAEARRHIQELTEDIRRIADQARADELASSVPDAKPARPTICAKSSLGKGRASGLQSKRRPSTSKDDIRVRV